MPYNYNPRARKFVNIDVSSNSTVLSGQSETVTITPPSGKVYSIIRVDEYCSPPSGATTGTHSFDNRSSNPNRTIVYIENAYSGVIQLRGISPILYSRIDPSDTGLFANEVIHVAITNTSYLTITYNNNTDVNQAATRTIKFMFEEFDELP